MIKCCGRAENMPELAGRPFFFAISTNKRLHSRGELHERNLADYQNREIIISYGVQI